MIVVHSVYDRQTRPYMDRCWQLMSERASDDALAFRAYEITSHGSSGHAHGLQQALQSANPDDLNVFCDSDVAVIKKGWDQVLRDAARDGLHVVGAPYEDVGGLCSGSGPVQTYKKYPSFVFLAAMPGTPIKKLNPMPNKGQTLAISNQKLSQRYNLPMYSQLLCDVGWQLPQFLEDWSLSSFVFENTRLRDWAGCKACDKSQELYLLNGEPFLAHQRSSSKIPYMEAQSRTFYSAVDLLLLGDV